MTMRTEDLGISQPDSPTALRPTGNSRLVGASYIIVIAMILLGYSRSMNVVAGHLFSDDAFYYFNIARNLVDGFGQSFDRLTPTNGFHPLWQYTLVAYFALLKLFGVAWSNWPRFVPGLQIVFWLGAVHYLRRIFAADRAGRLAVAWLGLIMLISIPWYFGMESGILAFFFALTLHLTVRWAQDDRVISGWFVGFVAGLTLLARLDMIFMIAVIGVILLARELRAGRSLLPAIARLLPIWLPPGVMLLAYISSNVIWFGDILPISGALKTDYTQFGRAFGVVWAAVPTFARLGLALSILWWVARLFGRRFRAVWSRNEILAADIATWTVFLHFAHTALFMDWAIFSWHFVTYNVTAVLLLALAVKALLAARRLPALIPIGLSLALAAFAIFQGYRKFLGPRNDSWQTIAYQAAASLRQQTPRDAIFYMKDCGIFGYFADRAVINGDGLVNDRTYQEYLREGRIADYLNDMGVDYFVQHAFPHDPGVVAGRYEQFTYPAYSHLYRVAGGQVSLPHSAEVYRSHEYIDDGQPARLIIWRFNDTTADSTWPAAREPDSRQGG